MALHVEPDVVEGLGGQGVHDLRLALGQSLELGGDLNGAIDCYKQVAAQDDARRCVALTRLSTALRKRELPGSALMAARFAVWRDREDEAAWRAVGQALKEIGWLVFVKLALHPLITWWLADRVFELEGILPAIAVIQAALPSGVPVFVLAQQYGSFVARSNAVIVISTALSVFTLSGLLIYLES